MKHILIILISIALLSSLLISCTESSPSPEIEDNLSPVIGDEHKGETLYRWGDVCCDYKWMGFGDKDTHPVYQGQVKDGKPNGLGVIIYPDGIWKGGNKYVGEWKDGKQNGWGKSTYGKGEWEGDVYEGEWKYGKPNGQGTYTYPDGRKYVGEYKDGERWNGKLYDKNGKVIRKWGNGVLLE